jgi:hypothetical protein
MPALLFLSKPQIHIEQNRYAMAYQGYGAVFFYIKTVESKSNSNIVKSRQITIKQDQAFHCL